MPKAKKEIRVYVTDNEKKQIQRIADSSNKSLSETLRDATLATNLDTAKMNFYQNITTNLEYLARESLHIKRSQFVINELVMQSLYLLVKEKQTKEELMAYYQKQVRRAEEKYPIEEE